jgi:tRNA nucleotidyltransferase (CCA-adding enzyme)
MRRQRANTGSEQPSTAGIGTVSWEHFAHGADIGVRGYGDTPAAAFEQAALAMTAVAADLDRISAQTLVEVACAAPEYDLLLVDWLNALIFEMATRSMLFSRFEVRLNGKSLIGRAWGETIDTARHDPGVEIKGATYTGLRVARNDSGQWVAECVVDV